MIGGPTASGKTGVAIQIAEKLKCEIISADSRQIYEELNIGTAKPTEDELARVPHHLIGHVSINDSYNVGRYVKEALSVITELHKASKNVVLVGGTGMYIKKLIEGLDDFPEVDKSTLTELHNIYESEGIQPLQHELKTKDPAYFDKVDQDNPHRLIRALSVIRSSGVSFSSYLTSQTKLRPWTCKLMALTSSREELYDRINTRVDHMMDSGLLEEVKSVYALRHLRSLDTVGYKELFKFLDGEWSLDQAVAKIKQHTRNYAKRQITWFSNQQDYKMFDRTQIDDMLTYIGES